MNQRLPNGQTSTREHAVDDTSPPLCRCCGSAGVFLRGRKPGKFIRREFAFYACRDCGFMSVEPFSGFEIYDAAYYRGEGPDPYVDYESEYRDWRSTVRVFELDDLARLAGQYVADRTEAGRSAKSHGDTKASAIRWLDFGCGAGGLLKYLRALGSLNGTRLELTGHDVGAYADRLRDTDGFRILDLQALSHEPDASYDVITMIEVIEHLPEPLEVMRQVARLLKPGGLLLLTTGNLDAPAMRPPGIHNSYCVPEIHVSLFNARALARIYQRVGLEPWPVRYRGAIRFKVLKGLRHSPVWQRVAGAALRLPPVVRLVDALYGVSAMPCAIKPIR